MSRSLRPSRPVVRRVAHGLSLVTCAAVAGCGSQAATGARTSTSSRPATTSAASHVDPQTSAGNACANGVLTSADRAALERADARPGTSEARGSAFFGRCGGTAYAVARFEPGASATEQQSVAFQDEGAYPEFFERRAASTQWVKVGGADGPPGPLDCATFTAAPAALRHLWNNCD